MVKQKKTQGGASAASRLRATKLAYGNERKRIEESGDLKYIHGNNRAAAFIEPATGDIVIGIKGTTGIQDWAEANILLPVGQLKRSQQYKDAKKLVDQMHRLYPNARIEVAGHSLGGAIAAEIQRDKTIEVVPYAEMYNGATQPQDYFAKKDGSSKRYHQEYDPLRALGLADQVIPNPFWGLEAHTIDNIHPHHLLGGCGRSGRKRMKGGVLGSDESWFMWAGDKLMQVPDYLSSDSSWLTKAIANGIVYPAGYVLKNYPGMIRGAISGSATVANAADKAKDAYMLYGGGK